ncbi:Zinc carboxypeptidase [Enterococcus saccharolyticus]|uniref:M14 family metallopeptidase n=1 Tax=Enterococcus saccharolyticus TaxID=41997 RepID=UPI00102873D6|nr:M14 family metallopeptidase [Enterococcus saccharolyticus]VFA67091.1 Zinc carboxypeptidase [Enterococcus saccharolyticus]
MVDKIEHIQTTDVLNTGRDKINKFAIDPAIRAEKNSIESKAAALKANEKSNDISLKQAQLEKTVESLVIESGTSDAEVVLSRQSNTFQQNFISLPERLEYSDALLLVSNNELKSIQRAGIYEPKNIPNTWVTDASGRVLNISTSEFFELFFNKHIGTNEMGITVKKNYLGFDESGTYQLAEFVFTPQNPTDKILLSSGMHTYELPASFGLAHFIKEYMDPTIKSPLYEFLRNNVEIKVIPIINPWGFNQNPKKYGNVNGVNINRNFDSNDRWSKFPSIPPEENEWNYKGSAPFSEAETKILRDWVLSNPDARLWIDCHTGLDNDYGENWIYPSSADPNLQKYLDTVKVLEERIKTKYNVVPRSRVVIDSEENLRRWWSEEVAGVHSMTIEQSSVNLPWGTSLNNEGDDIREYVIYITAYISALYDIKSTENFVNQTKSDIAEAIDSSETAVNILQLQSNSFVDSMPVLFKDSFTKSDGDFLGLGWMNEDNNMEISSEKMKLKDSILGEGRAVVAFESVDLLIEADFLYSKYVGFIIRQDQQNGKNIQVRFANNNVLIYEENVRQSTGSLASANVSLVSGNTYKIKVTAIGNRINVYVDGVMIVSAKTSIVTGGQFGVRIANGDHNSRIDNFVVRKLLRNARTEIAVNYLDWSGTIVFRSNEDGTVNCSCAELTVGTVPTQITKIADMPFRLMPTSASPNVAYNLTKGVTLYGIHIGVSTDASIQVRKPLIDNISKGDKLTFNFVYGI